MNLLSYYGLDHAWNKFCNNKKLKDELSAFLPNLPGNIDSPSHKDGSSLLQLIEKPPICGKEILSLGSSETAGFRLLPGSIPQQYRTWSVGSSIATDGKKRKRKHEHLLSEDVADEDSEKRAKRLRKEDERKEKKKKKKDKKKKKLMLTDAWETESSAPLATDFLNF